MQGNQKLLESYQLNHEITLKNRILMAPMTRSMATDEGIPTVAMQAYYERRADAGLIITEGTIISSDATGYKNVPGIYSKEQIEGWRQVTNAVHKRGGLIFSQIWHVGRVSHPYFLNGALPISSSATTMSGVVKRSHELNYGKARAATQTEIKQIINDYKQAAINARAAGFDGVEIHGANGYLIDQFLHYDTNHREDEYGGTIENMARFALEIVNACGEAIGFARVGLRISPAAYLNEIKGDSRDKDVFQYLLQQLEPLTLAYVHTGNFDDQQTFTELNNTTMTDFIRSNYHGNVIACGSYDFTRAEQGFASGDFDLVAIGRKFLANPDLIKRLHNNEIMRDYHPEMLSTLF